MLSNLKFIQERKKNNVLSAKLAHVSGLEMKEIIQMSESGIGDRISVRPSKYSSSRPLCFPSVLFSGGGKALVCVKCRLSSSTILADPELNAVVGLSKLRSFWKRNTKFSVYMLVGEEQMLSLCSVVASGKKFNLLEKKLSDCGEVILSKEGCYKTARQEAVDLVNVAGLNAEFILPVDSAADTAECSGPVENEFEHTYKKLSATRFQSEALPLRLEEDLFMKVQGSNSCCFTMCKKRTRAMFNQ
ncbi:DUF3023 domain-containing protein [Ehrlichia canis]|uniref:DUF3023 domain-containing protein n=1 Tax=Ehrlichia canis TaxID=944 RepID=UPI001F37A694|nr:DUF3023 domain-containing protein [Ehrlichia canis]UKC54409.1 hypothetical protein s20026770001_000515 [Ehrlichia canis]UKC55343.1 hypothetical protein s21009500007_000516 [Ehrlichia canis]